MTGLLADFGTEQALLRALERLRSERIAGVETYTPMALARQPDGSPLPLLMFAAGVVSFIGSFLLMTYADLWAYPQNIGGRPDFAWPAFIPIAFELGVLCAIASGFVGYFALCRLPLPYDPVDRCGGFPEASRNGWFLAVRSADEQTIAQARAVLDRLRPVSLEAFS